MQKRAKILLQSNLVWLEQVFRSFLLLSTGGGSTWKNSKSHFKTHQGIYIAGNIILDSKTNPPTPPPQNIYSNRTFSIFFRFFCKISDEGGGRGGRGYRNSRLGQNHRKFEFIPFIPSIIEWFPGDFLKFRGFPATFADFPWYNPRIDENWTSSVINCEQTTKHRKA